MTKEEYQNKVKKMRWSFSRLNGFANGCKYCWYQSYINRRYDESLDNFFSQYGIVGHEVLEEYYKGNIMIWDLLQKFQDEYFKNVTYDAPPNKYVDIAESYYEGGSKYFADFDKYDYVGNKYDIVSVEEEAKLNIKGYEFIGYIDLLLRDRENGEYVVYDHKSKQGFKSIKEQFQYARQLYLYSQYVYEKYGKYPKLLVFSHFRKQKYTEIKFNQFSMDEALNWVVETIDNILNAEDFPVMDNDFFTTYLCNYRDDEYHIQGKNFKLEDL